MKYKKIKFKGSKSLSKGVERSKEYLSLPKSKNLSEFDLESHKVIDCKVTKSLLGKTVVLMYVCKGSFTVEMSKSFLLVRKTMVYPELSWIEAMKLFKELV